MLANDESIILQSTTSTANSGLYEFLLPHFEKLTGIRVHVVAVGTGQALKNAENGDGDVVLVHSKEEEEKFVSEGYGLARYDVMYNDFVFVGPSHDPADIKTSKDSVGALKKIANSKIPFISRADNSGTHRMESSLWRFTKIDPVAASGKWYRESGSGMGATLNIAAGMGAYTLTDRGTWIAFKNKQDLEILFEGDYRLKNQYGVIQVNPEHHPHVRRKLGKTFVEWILSREGQSLIAKFRIDGQQLFFPNSKIEQ